MVNVIFFYSDLIYIVKTVTYCTITSDLSSSFTLFQYKLDVLLTILIYIVVSDLTGN